MEPTPKERCPYMLESLRQYYRLESMAILLVREGQDATVVRVAQDGSAWSGGAADDGTIAAMDDLARGIATDSEIDTSESAEAFDPESGEDDPGARMSAILRVLGEGTECQIAAMLGRGSGEDAPCLAVRYEPDRVRFMEAPASTFSRELALLEEFADEAVDYRPPGE